MTGGVIARMRRGALRHWLLGGAVLLVAACGGDEPRLPGERLDLRAGVVPGVIGDRTEQRDVARPVALPPVVSPADWTNKAGNARHQAPHVALSAAPQVLWSADIGAGDQRRNRLTADPVVAQGRIVTLDSRARVTATSTTGETLWSRDLTPPSDRRGDAPGGGLAIGGSTVYAATGFGEVTALDLATGRTRWTQGLGATATGAPVVDGGLVTVTGRDARGWGIDAATGRVRWQVSTLPSDTGILGGASPASDGTRVYLPFATGEIRAVNPASGETLWQGFVAGEKVEPVFARIDDLTGDPVVAGGRVYAGSHQGRTAALDASTGETVWTAEDGAMSPAAVAGDSVFIMSDRNELVRLDAATGERVWGTQLPLYVGQRVGRRTTLYSHYGPILASGRLVVVSNDGLLRAFSPESGRLLSTTELPGRATTNPVVVGQTLYVVTENGRLHALR